MKLIRKKWLAMALAVVMLVGMLGSGFAVSYTNGLFGSLMDDFVTKFKSNDLGNASKLYVALDYLNDNESSIEGAFTSALAAVLPEEKIHLENYGLDTPVAVMAVYHAFKDELPTSESDLINGDSLFARIFDDNTPTYLEYSDDFEAMMTRILDKFPTEFKNAFDDLAPTLQDKARLLYIMNDAFRNGTTTSLVGTGIRSTDVYTDLVTYTLNFDASLIQTSLIKDAVNNEFSESMSDSFVDAYMTVVGVVFEAMEELLSENTTASKAALGATVELLDTLDLITVMNKTTDSTPTGGGLPAPGPAPIPAPVEQPIPTPEKPTDITPNPDATYTSLAMRQALQLLNSDVLTQAKVDPVLEELEKEVLAASQDIVETLQIVERAEALVAKLLENDSLTDQGAINYANQILTQFIAPAITKDAMGGTHHELEALAASLIESVLERIGSMDAADVITDAMVKAAVSEQNNALVMMDEGLSAIFTDAEIAALSQNVSVELNGTIVKLDPAAVAYMKSNDIGIKVMTDSVAMTLPAAMMDSVRAGLSLVVELEPKSGSGLGNKMANGAQGTVGAAYELSVYLVNDQNAVVEVLSSVRPLVSLPVGNFRTNMHTVGAYYLNESTGEWEYVRSHVVNNRVVFQAPHLSTYGVLQRNIGFSDMTSHWAKSVIEELAVKGVVSGRSLTEYEPNGTITRAEFATILVQALQLEGDVKVTFNDVYSSDWYYEYVNIAALHGLVSGVGSGKFDPNAKITRQDMAIMIMKAYEKRIGTSVKSVPVGIKDLSAVSQYAKDRVLAARFNKLIGGYPDGSFMPLANATRAEAGQMVGNLLKK